MSARSDAGGKASLTGLPYRPCAGVVLVSPAGLVFGGRRIDNAAEAWQMPQGGIDSGETPRMAALRELREETGVRPDLVSVKAETPGWLDYDLPPELLGRIWGGHYRGQRQKWFLMDFAGSDADIDIATEHPEFDQWKWLTPAQMIDEIVPFKRAVYQAVFRAFADHLDFGR